MQSALMPWEVPVRSAWGVTTGCGWIPAVGKAPDLHVMRDSVPHNNLFWGDCSHCTPVSYDITIVRLFLLPWVRLIRTDSKRCLVESSQHPHELHYQSLLALELRK